MGGCKNDIIKQLERDILRLQPFNNVSVNPARHIGFGPFLRIGFPAGCLHEFLSASPEDVAASNGFVTALFSRIIQPGAVCAWISASRTLFPPALKMFGIEPDQIIFIDLKKEKDVLCAIEEALKCGRLTAVLGEVREINFTESRRLQLAAEQSRVTGFILRHQPRILNTLASVSRWRITSLPSEMHDECPGVGFARWNVELLKIRNGKPGAWRLEWSANRFMETKEKVFLLPQEQRRKTG